VSQVENAGAARLTGGRTAGLGDASRIERAAVERPGGDLQMRRSRLTPDHETVVTRLVTNSSALLVAAGYAAESCLPQPFRDVGLLTRSERWVDTNLLERDGLSLVQDHGAGFVE